MNVAVGDEFPDFALESPAGTMTRADLEGRHAVVYFYPKDHSGGCTRQAMDAQRLLPDLTGLGVALVGISGDPVDSHEEFAATCDLDFPLLADPGLGLCERLGIVRTSAKYPQLGEFPSRITFLVDPAGRIAGMWPGPDDGRGHMDLVAAEVRALLGAA